MKFILLSVFLLFSINVTAEYRVFTLQITNNKTNEVTQFDETLDPDQYQSFYGLKSDETITYINTWKCPGNTSMNKPLCSQQLDL